MCDYFSLCEEQEGKRMEKGMKERERVEIM
jgi:hypothetical protein